MKNFSTRCIFLFVILILHLAVAPVILGDTGKLISLDFKNADIKDVLRTLSAQEGTSFLIDDDVNGNVTIRLTKVTFTEALNILANNYKFVYTRENVLYHISKREVLKVDYTDGLLSITAQDARIAALFKTIAEQTGLNIVPPETTERVTLSFAKVTREEAIKAVLTQTNCLSEKVGNVLFVRKRGGDHSFAVTYQDSLLGVDAQNIAAATLFRAISDKTGVSVIVEPNLNANISIYFQGLPLKDGLNVLCETNGLLLSEEGAAWRIARKTGVYRIKATNTTLSVDVDGADVVGVINEIARQSKVNILVSKEVQGPITAHFQNVPFYQGLIAMLDTRGLYIEKQQDYYFVRGTTGTSTNVRVSYNFQSKLFDIEIQSSPVAAVINEMTRKAGLNCVVLSQVNWTINNIRLSKVSFEDALGFLLKGTVFTFRLVDNTYLIGDGMIVRPETADFSVVKIYPIKYIKSDQLLSTLPAFFPRQNFMNLPEKNALIVTATPSTHDLFASYLSQIDIESIDNRTEVVRIKNLKAEDVLKAFPASLPKTDVVVIKESNALVITGPQNLINQIKQYIEKIDQVNPMIVFDVLVVQISNSNGFTWGAPSKTYTLPNGDQATISPSDPTVQIIKPGTPGTTTDSNGNVTQNATTDKLVGTITALVQKGQAKILANPTISTLNGYPASFNVSTKWSFTVGGDKVTVDSNTTTQNQQVKTYETGLALSISPWVSANNQITMEVKPKISEFGEAPKGSTLPSTSERSTETTIRINNKETVVISGLKTTRKQKTVSKVPLLGDIPLLGYLFKNTTDVDTQDEFVIVITPYLVYDDATRAEANQKIFNRYNTGVTTELKNDQDLKNQPTQEVVDPKKKKKK